MTRVSGQTQGHIAAGHDLLCLAPNHRTPRAAIEGGTTNKWPRIRFRHGKILLNRTRLNNCVFACISRSLQVNTMAYWFNKPTFPSLAVRMTDAQSPSDGCRDRAT